MKNTKNIFLPIATITLFLTIQTAVASQEPNFEITNKSTTDISVYLAHGNNQSKGMLVKPQQRQQYQINPNDSCVIIINTEDESGFGRFNYSLDAPGKTKYVTWNPDKKPALYPQTGPLAGFGKLIGMKTASGLSLNNNIAAGQIKQNR
jgi:hypothetical protein